MIPPTPSYRGGGGNRSRGPPVPKLAKVLPWLSPMTSLAKKAIRFFKFFSIGLLTFHLKIYLPLTFQFFLVFSKKQRSQFFSSFAFFRGKYVTTNDIQLFFNLFCFFLAKHFLDNDKGHLSKRWM